MRKEILASSPKSLGTPGGPWLALHLCGRVQLTSEDPAHPIENALQGLDGPGWKAAARGAQTIWISFDVPQAIREIHVRFETDESRTQEFVLVSSSDGGRSYREIVRQQFNFSPHATVEDETYFPVLSEVTDVKLTILPDISGGVGRATLRSLRMR